MKHFECGLCEGKLAEDEGAVVTPSKVSLRLPIAKTFSHKANGTRGATFAAPTGGFYDRFLNNYFML